MMNKTQKQTAPDFSDCVKTGTIMEASINLEDCLNRLIEFVGSHNKIPIYEFEEIAGRTLMRYTSKEEKIENLYGFKYPGTRPDGRVQVFTPRDIEEFTSFTNKLTKDPDEKIIQQEIDKYSSDWKGWRSEDEIRKFAIEYLKWRDIHALFEKSIRHFDLEFCENGIIPAYENPFSNESIQMYAPLATIYGHNNEILRKIKMIGKDKEVQTLLDNL